MVGTGDFTHPEWIDELKDRLDPAEEGLYRLKPVHQAAVDEDLPERCRGTVRFVLSSEIRLDLQEERQDPQSTPRGVDVQLRGGWSG